jgi:hypothetical protein
LIYFANDCSQRNACIGRSLVGDRLPSGSKQQVVGGWARCLKLFLHHQLRSDSGLATAGVAVNIGGVSKLLWAELGCVLADGEGHTKAWDWKGAGSLKPCLKHYNILKKARCTK